MDVEKKSGCNYVAKFVKKKAIIIKLNQFHLKLSEVFPVSPIS